MKDPGFAVPGEHKLDPKFESKPSGYIVINGMEVAHTLQCCHCGGHFVSIHGSGIRRGYCTGCKKPTCGKDKCDVCAPFKVKLDYSEMSVQKDLQKEVKRIEKFFPGITQAPL